MIIFDNESLSTMVVAVTGSAISYFAWSFLQKFDKLSESVETLNTSVAVALQRLGNIESDHGRRIQNLEDKMS